MIQEKRGGVGGGNGGGTLHMMNRYCASNYINRDNVTEREVVH